MRDVVVVVLSDACKSVSGDEWERFNDGRLRRAYSKIQAVSQLRLIRQTNRLRHIIHNHHGTSLCVPCFQSASLCTLKQKIYLRPGVFYPVAQHSAELFADYSTLSQSSLLF